MSTRYTNVDAAAPAVPKRNTRLERTRSFTLEQFGDLVSSALDIQRIPDSALEFSFDKNADSEFSSTRRSESREPRHVKSRTFTKFKGAFTRRQGARDASLNAVPPEIRRLASSSTPVLPQPHFKNKRNSASLTSLELDVYGAGYDSPSAPATPVDSATFPSSNVPPSNISQQRTHTSESSKPDSTHDARKVHQSRSFLNLRPLTIPKLTKKSSKLVFSSGSPPTPPPEQSFSTRKDYSAASVELSRVESDGMHSFFDDSGYAESEHREPKMAKKKSKTGFRALFTSNQTESYIPPTPSLVISDSSLPPTPLTAEYTRTRQMSLASPRDMPNTPSPELFGQGSLFYTPQTEQHMHSVKHLSSVEQLTMRTSEKDSGANRVSNWINRPANVSPRKLKRIVKSSPPVYPCPTSPLPPTPELPAVGLPFVSPPNSDHFHAADGLGDTSAESIDSSEIMSWRMPALEQQTSKTSTTSSVQAHLLGRPSRVSIRDRLGLGPRLQLHVPLPTPPPIEMKSKFPADPRIHLSRLTSASLVSLRSVATITAGSKTVCDEENEKCRDALDVDRAFTPEDDPFAAGPVTPTTPLIPVPPAPKQQKQESVKSKYHSFMSLGNDSAVSTGGANTPISAPASLPSWCYRLGSSSNMSSPALTPPSSADATTYPLPTSTEASSTSPSSIRSGLPPSLIEALGVRRRAPSTPSFPPSSCRNLGQVLSRVRKVQNSQDGYSSGKKNGPGVAAHSVSRPHSPFPMLFTRSRGAKPSPTMEMRDSINSSASDVDAERFMESRLPYQSSKRVLNLPLLARRLDENVEAPVSPSASDIDSFEDTARSSELERARRDIVSPTAWLLDSDDYDDESAYTQEGSDITDRRGVLKLDMSFTGERTSEEDEFSPPYDEKMEVEPLSPSLYSLRQTSPPHGHYEAESETENEGDVTILRASQSWPLPPHRTVVVDEESGEGYHVVEPALEYAPARSVADSPRHSIRFPKRYSGSASVQSESGSPTSQKLNSFQARLIAEALGSPSEYDRKAVEASANNLQAPQAPALRQKFLRSRSSTSLAASAKSAKTTKTAYYTARSTASRGSDKSTFSFVRPQPFGKLSREGSARSACSSKSPSSGGHDAKTSPIYPASPPSSRSGPESSVTTLTCSTESPAPYQETVSIPRRIILRANNVEVCILAGGWARLMSICYQNSGVQIETSEGDNALSALSIAVEEVLDGCGTRIRPKGEIDRISDFESRPTKRANKFLKLTLSLHHQSSRSEYNPRAKIAFRLPLPATLGEVANMLSQTQPR